MQVYLDGDIWQIRVHGSPEIVSVRSGGEIKRWLAFRRTYVPTDAALRRFIEARRHFDKDVDLDDRHLEREVVGLVPIDEKERPRPPNRAQAYATLPVQEQLPFGMHVQADWLVDISRQGLREIEGDPWQQSIVEQIPKLLRSYLDWLVQQPADTVRHGYDVLAEPSKDAMRLEKVLASTEFRDLLDAALADEPSVLGLGDRSSRLRTALILAQVAIPPTTTAAQALGYLREVWRTVLDGREDVTVDRIRRVMPLAFGYVVEDDTALAHLKALAQQSPSQVAVYDEAQTWQTLDRPLYVDDSSDRRLRELAARDPELGSSRPVRASYLGGDQVTVNRVAGALGIPLLSSLLNPELRKGAPTADPPWHEQLSRLVRLLGGFEDVKPVTSVRYYNTLDLKLRSTSFSIYAHLEDDTLCLAGAPEDFGEDLGVLLVGRYRLAQQGQAVARLGSALAKITNAKKFERTLARLADDLGLALDTAGEASLTEVPAAASTSKSVQSPGAKGATGASAADGKERRPTEAQRNPSLQVLMAVPPRRNKATTGPGQARRRRSPPTKGRAQSTPLGRGSTWLRSISAAEGRPHGSRRWTTQAAMPGVVNSI